MARNRRYHYFHPLVSEIIGFLGHDRRKAVVEVLLLFRLHPSYGEHCPQDIENVHIWPRHLGCRSPWLTSKMEIVVVKSRLCLVLALERRDASFIVYGKAASQRN